MYRLYIAIISIALVGTLAYINHKAIAQEQLGAFSDPFVSIQLAESPSAGECLLTDGTNNSWGACAEAGSMTALPHTQIYVGNSSNEATATSSLTVLDSGYVGIGSTTPSQKLTVDGNVIADAFMLDTYATPSTHKGSISWNNTENTIDINTGWGPVNQVGYELWVLVHNDTGAEIPNGSVVVPSGGSVGGIATAKLAKADTHVDLVNDFAIATMSIPDGETGIVTINGEVRGDASDPFDTSAFSAGDFVYVGTSTDGGLTNIKPEFPNYPLLVGVVTASDATNGSIQVQRIGFYTDTFDNFHNGTFREQFDFRVSSDGSTITGSLEPQNGYDYLTMIFSDGFTLLQVNPATTTTLVAGTDSNPQFNYVYIPKSTKALTVSTTGFPTDEEYIYVAKLFLQSAQTTQVYDALRNQNINNEVQTTAQGLGFLNILGETIRYGIGARWVTGVEGSVDITVNGASPDNVNVSTTAGTIRQMQPQTFVAKDTSVSDVVFVPNDSVTAYSTTTDLNTLLTDASGNSLSGRSFSLVLWGVANKTGETSHLMINLPTNSYSLVSSAVNDINNYTVYDFPAEFNGVGFLIARFTFTHSPSGGGTWTLEDTEDLRGKIPNISAGGSAGGSGVTTFLGLTDTPSTYTASWLPRVNSGGTALEFINPLLNYIAVGTTSVASITTLSNLSITESQISDLSHFTPTDIDTDYGTETVTSAWSFTTATTTIAKLDATVAKIGSDYITDITGTGLLVSGGTLAVNQAGDFTWTGTHTFSTATTTFSGGLDTSGAHTKQKDWIGFHWASTTAIVASTTINCPTFFESARFDYALCYTDTGTLDVMVNDGTNYLNWLQASTTEGKITFTTNNTFQDNEQCKVEFGNPASSPTELTCNFEITRNY